MPEPDSPTIPSVFPASTVYEMPSTACTTPSSVENRTLQVLDLEKRFAHEYRTLGSRYAYAMSTTRLKKTMKNAPNNVMPWIVVRSDTSIAL